MKKQRSVVGVKSNPTGKYWPCPCGAVPEAHPTGPIANAIKLGPKGQCFCRCGCGTHIFFSRRFTEDHGFTLEQVRAMGLIVVG